MNALIFWVSGSLTPDNTEPIEKAVEALAKHGVNPHGVTVMRDREVAAIIIEKAREPEEKKAAEPIDCTPEDQAIIFLGTIMKNELEHGSKAVFVNGLINRIEKARKRPDKEMSREFMNSLFILSQEDLVISGGVMKKYNFDEEKIAIVKEVYNMVKTYGL